MCNIGLNFNLRRSTLNAHRTYHIWSVFWLWHILLRKRPTRPLANLQDLHRVLGLCGTGFSLWSFLTSRPEILLEYMRIHSMYFVIYLLTNVRLGKVKYAVGSRPKFECIFWQKRNWEREKKRSSRKIKSNMYLLTARYFDQTEARPSVSACM